VFLDRDGTIVIDPGYLRDPAALELVEGAAAAIRSLNAAGWLVVVVTNQAGIGRGKLTTDDYRSVAARLTQLLAAGDAHLDATYVCPHAPEIDGPCECRKPGLLLYRRAKEALGIDFTASWWVGDRISDLRPASALGGRGILVLSGHGPEHEEAAAERGFGIAPDLTGAAARILA
jgi:D-glycero-D-manno-heptose 1,7-bisphosphate phosphatase